MRRLTVAIVVCLAIAPVGCKSKRKGAPVVLADDGMLAAMVQAGDPRAAVQFVKGFYAVENNSWRWTGRAFTVTLRPPKTGAQKGGRLVLRFSIPDVSMERFHSLKLSAKVNGLDVAPEEYSTAGKASYSRDVPASALTGEAATVDFTLDKALPPTASDQRELGVIVSAVGFEAK